MSAQTFHVQAFIFVVILMVYVLTSHVIENHRVPYLHESSIAILMGIITAIIAKYALGKQIDFSNDLFFTIILPPIIFSAGYSLRKSLFFQNFGMISFLGIVGTVIGFILIAAYLVTLNHLFEVLSLTEILMLSSLLCATDTVAANSMIKAEKFPVLNAVLFGQGILNDAVAIILFGTVSKLNLDETGGQFSYKLVEQMTLDFSYLFFFSLAFGTISGFALSYLFKLYQSINHHPIKETSLILLNGYLTYLMGQLLGLSGIITLFTCAIIMGHYSFMNISEESQRGTGLAFETVSYISQAFLFTYLGASSLSINSDLMSVFIAFLVLLSLPIVRAIMVYILPIIYYCFGKKFLLSSKQLKVCWYSGIVRGVIAFALCLQIDSEHKQFIITVSLVIVMVTTLLGSSLMQTFVRWIGLQAVVQEEKQPPLSTPSREKRLLAAGRLQSMSRVASKYSDIGGSSEKQDQKAMIPSKPQGTFSSFESRYLKPAFAKTQTVSSHELTYSIEQHNKNRDQNQLEEQQE